MVTFRSYSFLSWAGDTAINITKPTGLTVGDLMVAQICSDQSNGESITPPSGWTQYLQSLGGSGNDKSVIFWKIADSADTSASTFNFSQGAANRRAGGIAVFYNTDGTTPIVTSNADVAQSGTNPSFNNTITPPANCILCILTMQRGAAKTNVSGYAIATDNPTWTETWDETTALSDDYGISMAYSAVRSATSATGNSSVVGGGTSEEWIGQIIAIQPPAPKTTTLSDTIILTPTFFVL